MNPKRMAPTREKRQQRAVYVDADDTDSCRRRPVRVDRRCSVTAIRSATDARPPSLPPSLSRRACFSPTHSPSLPTAHMQLPVRFPDNRRTHRPHRHVPPVISPPDRRPRHRHYDRALYPQSSDSSLARLSRQAMVTTTTAFICTPAFFSSSRFGLATQFGNGTVVGILLFLALS